MDILFITDRGEGLALAYTLSKYGHHVKFYNRHADYDNQGAGIIDLVMSWKPFSTSTDIVIIANSYRDTLDRNFPNAVILRTNDFAYMIHQRYDRSIRLIDELGKIPTLPHTIYESPDMAEDIMDEFPVHGVRILNTGQMAHNTYEYKYYLDRLPSVRPVVVSDSCDNSGWIHVSTLDWFNKERWTQPTMYATNHLMWLPKKKHAWLSEYSRKMAVVLCDISYEGPFSMHYRININTKDVQACKMSLMWDWDMIAVQSAVLHVDPIKYLMGDYIGSSHHYPAAYWLCSNEHAAGFPCNSMDLHVRATGSTLPINMYYDGIHRKASSDAGTHIQVMRDSIHDNPIGANFKKDLKILKRLSLAQ